MLIMTQDKEALINLDRVDSIEMKSHLINDTKLMWSLQANFYNSDGDVLIGAYETGTRARDILQQIADRQGGTSTYIMPEE